MMINTNYGINSLYNLNLYSPSRYSTQSLQDVSQLYSTQNTYNNIPTNFNTISALGNLKDTASQLVVDAKKLTSTKNDGSFQSRSLVSQDSNLVSGTALANAAKTTYSIAVNNIATSQTNTGIKSVNKDASKISSGTNTFTINLNGLSKDISFDASGTDTVEGSLTKMSSAINNAKLGVTAYVDKDSKTNEVNLRLVSNKTGEKNAFTIADKVGNAVAASGISNIITVSKNASYSVNGINHISESNNVTLDSGKVNLQLKAATQNPVKLEIKTDYSKVADDFSNFVNSFNDFQNEANKIEYPISSLKNLNLSSRYTESTLDRIGITINDDKTITFDKAKFTQALSQDETYVKNIVSNFNGIASRAAYAANTISQNPMASLGYKSLEMYNSQSLSYMYSNYVGAFFNVSV